MKVRVAGYLVEQKLATLLRQLVGERWSGVELKVAGTRRRWDMGFASDQGQVVVEFDGDEHYRNTLKIKADQEKDTVAATLGIRVVRVPYWVQLDSATFRHFFGFEAEIEQDFQHGFITTKIFPASFCELGVERFRRELAELPPVARKGVIESLRARAGEHGLDYVLPSKLRYLLGDGVPDSAPPCPSCSSLRVRRIIYGEPSPELGERADRGEVVIGGCVIFGNDPEWDCPDCGHQFGSVADAP